MKEIDRHPKSVIRERGMLNRDLLVAVCLAFIVHAVVFFVSSSRSTTLLESVEKRKMIEISLSEAPKPKPLLPKPGKNSKKEVKVKKIAKTILKSNPRPKSKPKIQPQPIPINADSVPKETIRKGYKDFLKEETNEETGKKVNRDIEDKTNIDKVVAYKIESLEESKAARNSKPVLPSTTPSYIENPKPHYPMIARKRKMAGVVLLKVEILENGRVGKMEVRRSSGYRILDDSALKAVKEWRFSPATMDGVYVNAWVSVPIRFELVR